MTLRPRLPKCATPAALYGRAKMDDDEHGALSEGRSEHTLLLGNHCTPVTAPVTLSRTGVAETVGSAPIRSGRTVVVPVIVEMFVRMFSGLPVCACSTSTSCQPSAKRLPLNGRSYDMLTDTRWRTSKSDGPTLPARFVLSCAVVVPSYEFVSVEFDSVYEPASCRP